MSIEIDLCGNGQQQSPINLTSNTAVVCRSRCNLLFHYRGSRCNIVRSGRTLVLNYDTGSHIIYNGSIYELERISFTNPGSHIIDGTSGTLECHLYHKAPDTGQILIIAIPYEINESSSPSRLFYDNWTHLIPTTTDREINSNMSSEWNIFSALPEIKSFYVYNGSIIQFPCSEGATWVVMSKFANISDNSYKKIVNVIGDNARKTQALNNRTILFNPNSSDRNNQNLSNPIMCMTDKELETRCAKINRTTVRNQTLFGDTKLLISIIIILVFMFVLIVVLLYKLGTFHQIVESLKPIIKSPVEIKGIGQA
jgi:carbonic anhydrase